MTTAAYGPELDRLAGLWSAQPTSRFFAPLAEALRKRGSLEQATVVAAAGVARRPEYLPGRVVMARIYADQQQWDAAAAELRAALELDPENPVVLDALAVLAPRVGALAADDAADAAPAEVAVRAETVVVVALAEAAPVATIDDAAPDGMDEDAELVEPEPLLTESLAMLYREQGHLEQALEVLDALVSRLPADRELHARRDSVRAELDRVRPRPFDADRSGGIPVRSWLASLAEVRAAAPAPSGFDEFYQAPEATPAPAPDPAAFQAWLKGLDR